MYCELLLQAEDHLSIELAFVSGHTDRVNRHVVVLAINVLLLGTRLACCMKKWAANVSCCGVVSTQQLPILQLLHA